MMSIPANKTNNRLQDGDAGQNNKAKGRDWGQIWLVVVGVGLLALWGILWHRFYVLHVVKGPEYQVKVQKQHNTREIFTGSRGSIEDRNGTILAKSVESYSLAARPSEILNLKETCSALSKILKISEKNLVALLADKKGFTWVARKISDQEAKAVFGSDLPGLYLQKESERIYPHTHLAGQLLGFVGMDNKGLDGLEASFEEYLAGRELRKVVQRDGRGAKIYMYGRDGADELSGKNLRLTIDLQIQHYAETALARTVQENRGEWGGCLVVDVATGDILAWAHYPFFNPNIYGKQSESVRRNKLALDALEQGSTVKAFVVAAALQEGKIKPDTVFFCEDGKWQVYNKQIKDTHPHKNLNVEQILRYSSNIGAGKIGLQLGAETYGKYLQNLGFGRRTGLPLAGENPGIMRNPAKWPDIDLISASFGQSFSANGLQMVQAYLCLASNGLKKPLQLFVDSDLRTKASGERIFSEETSKQLLSMLKSVVHMNDGLGRQARVAGFEVGGKTGTSQKAERGVYGEKRVASFIGMVPAEQPQYLVMVVVDEPKKSVYGAAVAAPAFREVTAQTLAYKGIMPDETAGSLADAGRGGRGASSDASIAALDMDLTAYAQNKAREAARVKTLVRIPGGQISSSTTGTTDATGATAVSGTGGTVLNQLRFPLRTDLRPEAEASRVVPDVRGMSVRSAVEVFAHEDIMPVLKGQGSTVARQSPEPGAKWSYKPGTQYILWLEDKTL